MRKKQPLGQNFLTDPHIASEIVQLARIQPEGRVVEIGPGKGLVRFKNGPDAMEFYDNAKYNSFSAEDKGDIRIEFIHFRFGVPRIHRSRILFP